MFRLEKLPHFYLLISKPAMEMPSMSKLSLLAANRLYHSIDFEVKQGERKNTVDFILQKWRLHTYHRRLACSIEKKYKKPKHSREET